MKQPHNDLVTFIVIQREWSDKTFGTGLRTEGICKHIEKELNEIRANPTSLEEWIDVVILALDGAWRVGYSPLEIVAALAAKQDENIYKRRWGPIPAQDEISEHLKPSENGED